MKYDRLRRIDKFCFGFEDIARAFGISLTSAKVTASRYVKQGFLLRMKKNLYVTRDAWNSAGQEEKFRLANFGQVPSYISLMTALDYFELTTQVQRDYFESVATKRSKEIELAGALFRYVKVAPALYHTFRKEKEFFIASPEKALIDAFYLMSFGRYRFDLASLDASKFDRRQISRLIQDYPQRTKKMMVRYGYLSAA